MTKFKCIKGLATDENVVIMQNDEVEFISHEEGDILVIGIKGWCEVMELTFTPKQLVEHFESIID
jgi:hypothetical protein